jgi:hypothetical protein
MRLWRPTLLFQTFVVASALCLTSGCGGSGPKDPAAAYYDQIRSLERDLVHAARADDVDKLQQVLADGETDLPKMQPPAWARTDHARLTHEWAQLASDLANARDEPGGGFESDVAADVRQINVTTADLATAVTAHRP